MMPSALTPAQLADLLAGDWQTTGPLRMNLQLTADDLAPAVMFVNTRRILAAIDEMGGAPATSEGRFAPEFVGRIAQLLWWGRSGEWEPDPWDPPEPTDEVDFRPLEFTRVTLQLAGVLVRKDDHLVITPEGVELMARDRGGELYGRLLRAYLRDLDHSAIDSEPAIPDAWRYVPYSLWMIGELQPRWWPVRQLLRVLLPREVVAAENARLRTLPCPPERSYVPNLEPLYLMRFIEPMQDFGLLQSRPARPGNRLAFPEWRRGVLYERVVRFEFKPPEP